MGNDIAPGSNFNLDAQVSQQARHIGYGLLQGQVFTGDKGADIRVRFQAEQGLRVGIQALYFFNDELRAGLYDFFNGTALNRTQNSPTIHLRNIRWQLNLNLKNLLITIFRIYDIILR